MDVLPSSGTIKMSDIRDFLGSTANSLAVYSQQAYLETGDSKFLAPHKLSDFYGLSRNYTITPDKTSVNEGQEIRYAITTKFVQDTIPIYWRNEGSTVGADFTDGLNQGQFNMTNGNHTLVRTLSNDNTTEGNQNVVIKLYKNSARTELVATAATVTVVDTSLSTPTYSVTASPTSVNEGSTITFTITVGNVQVGTNVYWDIIGTGITESDFTDSNGLSGIITLNSGTVFTRTATITKIVSNDLSINEGNEALIFRLGSGPDITQTQVATAGVTIIDTSKRTFTLTGPSSVNEGATATFNASSSPLLTGTTQLFWRIVGTAGTINLNDFVLGSLDGTVPFQNGTGSFGIPIRNDQLTENITEEFKVNLYLDSGRTNLLAESGKVTINDTSKTPGYSIVPRVNGVQTTNVNEGQTIDFGITVTNVPTNRIYWELQNPFGLAGINMDDISGITPNQTSTNPIRGFIDLTVVTGTGTGTVSVSFRNDLTTEGLEYFNFRLFETNAYDDVKSETGNITVNDTSLTPQPIYSLSANVTEIVEGQSVTFTLNTQNVSPNSTYYWKTTGNVTADDFEGLFGQGEVFGELTTNNNTGQFTLQTREDYTGDPNETFIIQMFTDSNRTNEIATSQVITIREKTYSITPNTTSVNEGGSVIFTINTSYVNNGTRLYWTTFDGGGINSDDFTDFTLSGFVDINNSTGTITRTIREDFTTEGVNRFRIQLRDGSTSGPILVTSQEVTINDTSLTPQPTYQITGPNAQFSLNEGDSGTFVITTNNVPNGTNLQWYITPGNNTTLADFSNPVSGTVTIQNGTASFTIFTVADQSTEGTQYFLIDVERDGVIVVSTPVITLNDTSQDPVQTIYTYSFNASDQTDISTVCNNTIYPNTYYFKTTNVNAVYPNVGESVFRNSLATLQLPNGNYKLPDSTYITVSSGVVTNRVLCNQ